ncbi:MAG: NAD(P)/FAD-dependent oxidoreductase [Anaerolineae bacterium]|nr:NAD(P)/FAD-dependent oxidoreductase [Anaerolineae bacterium]
MTQEFDVIIVGAGPGGSVAATVAAQHGLKTLLLNREAMPRDKACGDAVPEPAFLLLRKLGMTNSFNDYSCEIDFVKLVGPGGQQVKLEVFPQSGEKTRIVTRHTFDNLLCQHAMQSGAEFRILNVTDPLLDGNRVIGISGKEGQTRVNFYSKVVIAADGATSAISRGLNIGRRPDRHVSISMRGYVETKEELDPVIELAFLRNLIPGYGWIFPVNKHYANIGVGLTLEAYKVKQLPLTNYLEAYLKTPHIRKTVGENQIERLKSWQLPICTMEQKRVFNGAILIGDAGGFVNPLTGAGIYPAMTTGRYAAEVAAKAIQKGDLSENALKEFESLWRTELERGMRYSTLALRTLTRFPLSVDLALLLGRLFPSVMRTLLSKV